MSESTVAPGGFAGIDRLLPGRLKAGLGETSGCLGDRKACGPDGDPPGVSGGVVGVTGTALSLPVVDDGVCGGGGEMMPCGCSLGKGAEKDEKEKARLEQLPRP